MRLVWEGHGWPTKIETRGFSLGPLVSYHFPFLGLESLGLDVILRSDSHFDLVLERLSLQVCLSHIVTCEELDGSIQECARLKAGRL